MYPHSTEEPTADRRRADADEHRYDTDSTATPAEHSTDSTYDQSESHDRADDRFDAPGHDRVDEDTASSGYDRTDERAHDQIDGEPVDEDHTSRHEDRSFGAPSPYDETSTQVLPRHDDDRTDTTDDTTDDSLDGRSDDSLDGSTDDSLDAADHHDTAAVPTERPPQTDDDWQLFGDADADGLRTRWAELQGAFVDDPRQAVRQAEELVGDVVRNLTERFEQRRSELATHESADTEELRLAMRRYRAFFQQLLGG